MTIQPGEFWVADIPFTDASGSKKRPVLVLWLDADDVVVAAVTSAEPRSPRDVPLSELEVSRIASGFDGSLVPIGLPRTIVANRSNWNDFHIGWACGSSNLDRAH